MSRRSLTAAALSTALAVAAAQSAHAKAETPQIEITPALSQSIVKAGETTRIYLRLGIKVARTERAALRAPLNLALVIDRSGSMQGARIEGARQAAMMAIDRLSPRDVVSVVSYDDRVEIEVPATRATNPSAIKARIARLTPRGSTAIHAGMLAGLDEVRKFRAPAQINRIILLSDGLANVGPSSPDHFARLGREIAGEGITVSTIGLGLGYNEDLMARLARNADGSHVFVQEPAELTAFLNREIDDVQSIFAQDIDVTIELKANIRPIRGLGRDAEIKGERLSWRLGQLVGGSEQVLLAELEAPAELAHETRSIGVVRIGYRATATGETASRTETLALAASSSEQAIEAGLNSEVMREAALLIARERKDAAIKLRDAGRIEEARKAFEANAVDIDQKASRYKFKIEGQIQSEQETNRAAASPASAGSEAWNRQRKIMRSQDSNAAGASVRY